MSEWIEHIRPGRVERPTKSIFRDDGSSAELSVSRHPSYASDEPRESLMFHVSGQFDVDAMEQAIIEAFKVVVVEPAGQRFYDRLAAALFPRWVRSRLG